MKKLTKVYEIQAPLAKVYDALINPEHIEGWSGSEATMDIVDDGAFSLWEGSIHGINRSVSPQQIVQDWKEATWETFSQCTFNLHEQAGVTTLELIHENIPESSYKSIDNGWDEYYLGPLKSYVENN